ncbi:hypothetical protein [Paraburkholderia sp. J67]|uniref:hypothetical protein n=1 Tax=Paraburkholderia sp. J67 TaxID=2805435 RepID=UPI002ABD4283|nr:hypothetical protein [Paraburkholderia sp. J67]
MQRRLFEQSLATVIAVALATILLAACGPGATSPATPESANGPGQAQSQTQNQPQNPTASAANLASSVSTATPADTANPASYAYASDPVQSVQASLAADNQQVAPVMSYAPGDEPQTNSSNSNTATTRQ